MSRFLRPIKEGFIGITRNFALSLSSISSVTITLILVSVFILLTANIRALTLSLEQAVEIHVIISNDVNTQEAINELEASIESLPNILEVNFSSKDDELEYFIAQQNDDRAEELYGKYRGEGNPMKNAFLITVVDGQTIRTTVDSINSIEGIEKAQVGDANTENFMNVLQTIRDVGFVLVIALSVIAIFLISNTIRVSIHSRSNEISIMRTVGASNWYIRWPFIIEGMIIGAVGSLLPILCTIFGYKFLLEETGGAYILGSLGFLPADPLVYQVSFMVLGIGMIVGALGSLFSVGKFLRWTR